MQGSKRYSHQREEIYSVLWQTTAHPTAETVYAWLKPSMPKLSLKSILALSAVLAFTVGIIFVYTRFRVPAPSEETNPIIEEIAEEHSEYKVCKIDVDEERGLAMRFGVMSIPTVIIFKNGEISDTVVGLRSKDDLLDLLA